MIDDELQPVADELRRRMAAGHGVEMDDLPEPSEGPFEFSWFCRHNGEPIQTVADVCETLTLSAEKSTRAELYGVALAERDEDGKQIVVCYTGNGPRSEANARLIAKLLSDYRTTPAPDLPTAPISEAYTGDGTASTDVDTPLQPVFPEEKK